MKISEKCEEVLDNKTEIIEINKKYNKEHNLKISGFPKSGQKEHHCYFKQR